MRPVLAILAFVLVAGCVDSAVPVEPAEAVPEAQAPLAPLVLEGTIAFGLGTPRIAAVPASLVSTGGNGETFVVPEGADVMRATLTFTGTAPGGMALVLRSPGDSTFESSTGPGGKTADVEVEAPAPGEWMVTLWPIGPVQAVDWTVEVEFA